MATYNRKKINRKCLSRKPNLHTERRFEKYTLTLITKQKSSGSSTASQKENPLLSPKYTCKLCLCWQMWCDICRVPNISKPVQTLLESFQSLKTSGSFIQLKTGLHTVVHKLRRYRESNIKYIWKCSVQYIDSSTQVFHSLRQLTYWIVSKLMNIHLSIFYDYKNYCSFEIWLNHNIYAITIKLMFCNTQMPRVFMLTTQIFISYGHCDKCVPAIET